MALIGESLKKQDVCVSCDIFTDYIAKRWQEILDAGGMLDLAEAVDEALEIKAEIEKGIVICQPAAGKLLKGYYGPKDQWDEMRADAMMMFEQLSATESRRSHPFSQDDQERVRNNIRILQK